MSYNKLFSKSLTFLKFVREFRTLSEEIYNNDINASSYVKASVGLSLLKSMRPKSPLQTLRFLQLNNVRNCIAQHPLHSFKKYLVHLVDKGCKHVQNTVFL